MLSKAKFILVFNLVLAFFAGAALAADDARPAGIIEKTVVIQKKFNTFDDSKLKQIRGRVDLDSFDRMVGHIVVDAKYVPGKNLQDNYVYRFNGLTDVMDKKGNKITMKDLVIPCKAKISFYPNQRKSPILSRIKVVKTFKSGDRAWTVEGLD